jgi:serine protease
MTSRKRDFALSVAWLFLACLFMAPAVPFAGEEAGAGQNPAWPATDALARPGDDTDDERFIVGFHSYGPEARAVVHAFGGDILLELPNVRAAAARLPQEALRGLRNHPAVRYVEPDYRRYPMSNPPWNEIVSGDEIIPYGIQMVQADMVSDASVGNRKICIIDSGYFRGHNDLQHVNVTASPDIGTGDPWVDRSSHGTHVAGTIAGIGGNGTGVRGVAHSQRVNLHIVKVFGDSGSWAYSSTLVHALDQCVAADANIVSMSLGGSGNSTAESDAFAAAYGGGILSVAAAGNGGSTAFSYPASYDSVVSVGGVDRNEAHYTSSQRNSQVEIAAPAVAVLSTVAKSQDTYVTVGGATYVANPVTNSSRTTGTAGLLADGGRCTATDPSWNGLVVLCERGDVSFWDKVRNVQDSGGVAAVIYNNATGNFFATLSPNVSVIPAVTISQEAGLAIIASSGVGSATTVRSTYLDQTVNAYASYNGTSMATPHVSAVAALVWSHDPSWTNAQIRAALQASARDIGDPGRDDYFGHGIVQAKGALDYLCPAGCPPQFPAASNGDFCINDTSEGDLTTGMNANVNLILNPGNVRLRNTGDFILDQTSSAGSTSGFGFSATTWYAQTFTPDESGLLARVDLHLFCSACAGTTPDLIVSIRDTAADLPTGGDLTWETLPGFSSPFGNWYTVNFSSPLTVAKGTRYAIVVRASANPSAGTYAYIAAPLGTDDSYTRGRRVTSTNSGGTWTGQVRDVNFRTYVTGAPPFLFLSEGFIESSTKDARSTGNWAALDWTATLPGGTDLKFQVGSASSANGTFEFVGPDGTPDSFFTSAPASLSQFDGQRFLRYRAHLSTSDPNATPELADVTICGSCDAPVQGTYEDLSIGGASTIATPSSVPEGAREMTVTASPGFTGTVAVNPSTGVVSIGSANAGQFTITVTALNDCNSAAASFILTVVHENAPPVLGAIGDKTVAEGSTLAFTVTATDADGDTLAYSATGLPTGALLDNATGAFSWTPDYSQAGSYEVTFTVSDGDLTDSETITITVTNTNRAPMLSVSGIGNKSVRPGETLSFTLEATDVDGDTLTYGAEGLPTGASLGATSGDFSWVPTAEQIGTHEVTFSVSDGMGGSDSELVAIRVSTGLKFYTLAPCRVVDTRFNNGAYGSPALENAAERSFMMTGQCGIPPTAKAVSLNATITEPTAGPGFLALYPGETARPLVSMLNYTAGQTRANNAMTPLGAEGHLTAYIAQGTGSVQLIIDVTGYFE